MKWVTTSVTYRMYVPFGLAVGVNDVNKCLEVIEYPVITYVRAWYP